MTYKEAVRIANAATRLGYDAILPLNGGPLLVRALDVTGTSEAVVWKKFDSEVSVPREADSTDTYHADIFLPEHDLTAWNRFWKVEKPDEQRTDGTD